MSQKDDEKAPPKLFVSELLRLPLFQEQGDDEEDTTEMTAEEQLSIQKALIDYFLNLPAFHDLPPEEK